MIFYYTTLHIFHRLLSPTICNRRSSSRNRFIVEYYILLRFFEPSVPTLESTLLELHIHAFLS